MQDGEVVSAFFINKTTEVIYLNLILVVYMDSCIPGFSHSRAL